MQAVSMIDDVDPDESLRDIAEEMRRLAILAGYETLAWFRKDGLKIRQKDDASPVTEADLAANDVITRGLRRSFAEIPILSEEGDHILSDASQRYFLVDPLDGTKQFINGEGEFTVNIALIEEGVPLLGVVLLPATSQLFWTPDADFAVCESGDFAPRRISKGARLWVRAPGEVVRIVASKSHRSAETDAFIARFKQANVVGVGSSLKLCRLAEGAADIYPCFGRTCSWDIAAGHAILRAAGGEIRVAGSLDAIGQPLRYDPGQKYNPNFVAYGSREALAKAHPAS